MLLNILQCIRIIHPQMLLVPKVRNPGVDKQSLQDLLLNKKPNAGHKQHHITDVKHKKTKTIISVCVG